jgi:hypothetical protein
MKNFNALIIDVETHMKSIHHQIIYNIGWVIGNARDTKAPRKERDFFVKEFLPLNYWKHSFEDKDKKSKTFGQRKFWKMDSRGDAVQRNIIANPHKVKSWNEIMEILEYDASMVDGIGSYNWAFDSKAIDKTNRNLNHEGIVRRLDPKKFFCLMDCFANKVINRNYFIFIDALSEVDREKFKSKSGKSDGYSAQIMVRYAKEHLEYIEAHESLPDSKVEFELLEYFLESHNKDFMERFLGNPKFVSWTKIRDRLTATEKILQRELL